MAVKVEKIQSKETLQKAFDIRHKVFVIEQNVAADEEYEFEDESIHFLALVDGNPAGTARWRFTDKGVKLERFAVLQEYRSSGVGSALVKAVVEDINADPKTAGKLKYLHSQLTAMGLYSKHGFKQYGEMFEECNIQHYKMILD